jgi:endoglucanase
MPPLSRRVAAFCLCASLLACSTTDEIAPDGSLDGDAGSDESRDGAGDGRDGAGGDGAQADGAQEDGEEGEPDGGAPDGTPDETDAGWQPPGFVHTDGTNIVDGAGNRLFFKGINLGNWLVWEGYLMMGDFEFRTHSQFFDSLARALGGSQRAADFEYAWRLNYVDDRAISDLKALGFDSVRVPFNHNLFWWDNQLRDNGFEFFDAVIDACRRHGLYVLLDMHGAPGYQNPGDHSDNGNSNSKQPRESVRFWDDGNVEIAARVWRHIAARYKDEPVVWGYDLVNEPVTQHGREYELLPSYVVMRNAIREVDPNHTIVVEGSWWGSDLSKIDWQDGAVQSRTGISSQWDDNLVYQIHHYGPAQETFWRVQVTQRLNVPLIIGEYGESDDANLRAITDWAQANLAGAFPWSFKKMSHDKTLWTIPPNDDYEAVKSFINHGGTPPTHLYEAMLEFARSNVKNGHESLRWHQSFYDAVHIQ